MTQQKTHQIYKMAVLGDGAVGKSSLIRAKKRLQFEDKLNITIGVDIQCIPFEYKQMKAGDASFLAVDLGGQKRFHFIHDAYLSGIKFAVVTYDLSRYRTFMNIQKWLELVYHENPIIPILVVGTKSDLVNSEKVQYFKEEFQKLQKTLPNKQNIMGHFFISAKTGEGIDKLFLNCENLVKMYYGD